MSNERKRMSSVGELAALAIRGFMLPYLIYFFVLFAVILSAGMGNIIYYRIAIGVAIIVYFVYLAFIV